MHIQNFAEYFLGSFHVQNFLKFNPLYPKILWCVMEFSNILLSILIFIISLIFPLEV